MSGSDSSEYALRRILGRVLRLIVPSTESRQCSEDQRHDRLNLVRAYRVVQESRSVLNNPSRLHDLL